MFLSLSSRRAWIEIVDSRAYWERSFVALLTESVDRNQVRRARWYRYHQSLSSRRAWIEMISRNAVTCKKLSLSSRRAWIEILTSRFEHYMLFVALLTESVDRNSPGVLLILIARVALLTESVDRNVLGAIRVIAIVCRSPHGERG